jgi:hypothetical protein
MQLPQSQILALKGIPKRGFKNRAKSANISTKSKRNSKTFQDFDL